MIVVRSHLRTFKNMEVHTDVSNTPSCEAVPLVDASVPTAQRISSADHTNEDAQHYEYTLESDMDVVLIPGFVMITALEATTNSISMAFSTRPPTPQALLCILCPWLGCFGGLNGNLVYLGIYYVYAIHLFLWRLIELIWLTQAPLGHIISDHVRVVTVGDAWTLQMLVLFLLIHGWLLMYTLRIVRVWWRVNTQTLPL